MTMNAEDLTVPTPGMQVGDIVTVGADKVIHRVAQVIVDEHGIQMFQLVPVPAGTNYIVEHPSGAGGKRLDG